MAFKCLVCLIIFNEMWTYPLEKDMPRENRTDSYEREM
jgi:hypothetical protein